MKSGLTPLFSDADIDRWFDKFQERAEERIFKLLSAAGEKFVEVARKSGNYTDRTGNLRSSVGYIIAMDGETVSENFEKSGKGNDGDTGISKARQLAEDISLAYQGSYVLIGVAGMEYAVHVEAKGKDVATTGYIQCQEYLRKALKKMLAERGQSVNVMLDLDVPEDELMKRLIKRGQESGRADDNEETIKKRLTVYHSQTAPLIDWYKNEKLYAHIKGIGELETITADVCKAIDAAK